ncbi:hypothetical protein Fmac_000656 [Flemingia macrophylla]|uniref:WRKY domain-containing protein n=1 Tax=Flemingia macrophylla TaxID=520843 RepID=A0ABD1NF01_9FABA
MDEKVGMLEAKLRRVKEENCILRARLETLSSICEKLHSYIKEINDAEQKSHQNGSTLARPEFSQAQRPSRIFVRTHSKDTSLMVKDGYRWKKYGQKKATRDNPSPRGYFRCSMTPTCPVKKRVQRSMQDRSILVATYEGKHDHGVFGDLLKPSSSKPEGSMANNLSMTIKPKDKDATNIDLALCNWTQRDSRLGKVAKQQNERGSDSNIEDYVSSIIKDPDFITTLAEAVVQCISSQSKQLGLNLNLGLHEPNL